MSSRNRSGGSQPSRRTLALITAPMAPAAPQLFPGQPDGVGLGGAGMGNGPHRSAKVERIGDPPAGGLALIGDDPPGLVPAPLPAGEDTGSGQPYDHPGTPGQPNRGTPSRPPA